MIIVSADGGEDVIEEQPSVTTYIGQTSLGSGVLSISESQVVWRSDSTAKTVQLQYPQLMLHAVSRDRANFAQPCLYLMVDKAGLDVIEQDPLDTDSTDIATTFSHLSTASSTGNSGTESLTHHHHQQQQQQDDATRGGDGGDGGDSCSEEMDDAEDGGSEEQETVEVRFVPADQDRLEALFAALSRGQSAHPDPELSDLSDCGEYDDESGVNGVGMLDGDHDSDSDSLPKVGLNRSAPPQNGSGDPSAADHHQFEDVDE